MIMPYGRKATQVEAGKGPAEIDFNALWDRVYVPVITALGYEPVRADQDTGALIVTEMLERLYFADLVLADMTIPNGNVYYEIGIRHAAKPKGCVLLAADWSKPLFDLAQMRTGHYPLTDGDVPDATVAAAREAIERAIRNGLAKGMSPMWQVIRGYPGEVDPNQSSTMKDQMAQLAEFQARVRAVRTAPARERLQRAQDLAASFEGGAMTAPVAFALMLLLRDCADRKEDWNVLLGFVNDLPEGLKALPEVREQRALALSYAGWHDDALVALDALVTAVGPTPERLGLMGGRHKRLYRERTSPEDKWDALQQAIGHYERGMDLDLNQYYCASNLPRLYRARKNEEDEVRAQQVANLVVAACDRARKRGSGDAWLKSTLLAAAFDLRDVAKAKALMIEVESEGAARWQRSSVLDDLRESLDTVTDLGTKAALQAVLDRFARARS
jgi:hypothetical protein